MDDIPGIGETRRKALMRKFKSVENIRDASLKELAETESMNAGSAQKVYEFFFMELVYRQVDCSRINLSAHW